MGAVPIPLGPHTAPGGAAAGANYGAPRHPDPIGSRSPADGSLEGAAVLKPILMPAAPIFSPFHAATVTR
jgi:hypothetical protein